MTSRAELSPPTPFPTRTFVAIGVLWVLTDLTAMAILWSWGFRNPWFQLIAISWQAVLAAKAMLMLGWWFLGEGKFGRRLAGGLLFAPIFAPALFTTVFEPELFCVLGGLEALAVPGACVVGLPFLMLAAIEYRLARDTPPVKERMTTGLQRLSTMKNLEHLDLNSLPTSVEVCRAMAELPRLANLVLSEAVITDDALLELGKSKSLRRLNLTKSEFSEDTLAKVRQMLPMCEIVR